MVGSSSGCQAQANDLRPLLHTPTLSLEGQHPFYRREDQVPLLARTAQPGLAEFRSQVRVPRGMGTALFSTLTSARTGQATLPPQLGPGRRGLHEFPTVPHLARGSPPAPLATPHGLQGHSRERGQRVTIALNCLNPGVTHVTSTHSPLARASPVTQPNCKGGWEMWTSSWTMRGCARAGAHHIQRQCAPQMPGLVRDNTLSCYITHSGFLF